MGHVSVDLHTLATGPVSHELTLRAGGKPMGMLKFDVEMIQLTIAEVALSDVKVTGLQLPKGGRCNPRLMWYIET